MDYESSLDDRRGAEMTAHEADHAVLADEEYEAPARRKRLIVIAAIVAAAIVLVAIVAMALGSGGDVPDNPEANLPAVTVMTPGRSEIVGSISATGTLYARRPMPVGSVGEGGRVSRVLVDAGDWVREGQVLAVIDRSVQSQQIAAQAAQVEVARSNAQLAEANLQRALKLVDRGFISTADVGRLTATRDSAVASVRVAEAQLGELRARTARLNILAPAAGLVLERNVEDGQVVSGGGSALFLLARGGEMELAAKVNEADLSLLSVGVSAQVTPIGTDRTFVGEVWQVSPTIDVAARQGEARIALPYDLALRPGGFATARIETGIVTAPLLPETAIMSDDEGSYVYVLDKEDKAQRRNVETGRVNERGIIVTGGLDGSERVVMRAGGFLTEGDKVNPVAANASAD